MGYLYETHLHTCQGSACGVSTGAEQARFYHDLGFDGVFITDHFLGGNTAVDRSLPWKELVDQYVAGYQDAYNEGSKLGLKVFFGIEQGFQGDEFLLYGLTPDWLRDHPQAAVQDRGMLYQLVHEAGGCMVQAHPFRDRSYIDHVRLGLQFCDGAEALNGGNDRICNECALNYAREYHLPMTAGSDNHEFRRWRDSQSVCLAYVETDTPLRDGKDFADRIMRRESFKLHCDYRTEQPLDERHIESFWLDSQGRRIPTLRDWYIEFR